MSCSELQRRQAEVERLLDRLRRLVREQRELEERAAGAGALEANREEAERVRWRIAKVVKTASPAS